MGIRVSSCLWVLQDFYHQPYVQVTGFCFREFGESVSGDFGFRASAPGGRASGFRVESFGFRV